MKHDLDNGKHVTGLSASDIGAIVGLWNAAVEDFKKRPEPTQKDLASLLTQMRGELRYKFRDAMLKIGKKLPHRPGGAPKALTATERDRILQLVAGCVQAGQTPAEAVRTLATRFGVSTKTIQRWWHRKQDELRSKSECEAPGRPRQD